MSSPLVVEAPAKLNLSLEVKRKREDGFHEIETLMARLKLSDIVEIHKARGLTLEIEGADLPVDESNLVMKAVKVFGKKRGSGVRKKIVLKKRIPSGAGLGGGSSDAAATLIALNEEYETHFSTEELSDMAAEIGCDVPFFLYKQTAICRGRGEIVEPTHIPDLGFVLLLKPSFSVPTAEAYAHWEGAAELPGVSYAQQEFKGVKFVNDLELAVFQKYLFLPVLKDWLQKQEGVSVAMMSGSGSTVYALVEDQKTGELIAQAARKELDAGLWSWCGNIVK